MWVQHSQTLFPKLALILGEMFSLAWAIFCISCSILGRLYRVCKRPIAYSVAGFLCTLIVLNVFATGYTIATGNILDTFCPKRLPLLRNLICSRWDLAQTGYRDLSATDPPVKLPYVRYLAEEDSTLSYKLPHALSMWEQAIRTFRASVTESEYPLSEQDKFHKEFSDYIDLSVSATDNAHHFYAHMMGTVNHHTINTRWLLQKLRAEGPLTDAAGYINGPLATSMEVLSAYGMVYLPNGLQPFQQNALQQHAVDAVELMKSYMHDVKRRLGEDILMINALRLSLNDLAIASDTIRTHASQLWSDNQRASVAIQPQWWQLFSKSLQHRLDRYTIDQQALWLGQLRGTVGLYSERLHMMGAQFQAAQVSCSGF